MSKTKAYIYTQQVNLYTVIGENHIMNMLKNSI